MDGKTRSGLSRIVFRINNVLCRVSPDALSQTEGALTGLRLAYSGIPITGTLIAMYVMRDYDLNEDRAYEIKQQLEIRRQGESPNVI